MKTQRIVIIGCSGHSKVIIDIFEKTPRVSIIGLLDAHRAKGEKFLGYEVLGSDDHIVDLLANDSAIKFFVAIGDNATRSRVVSKIMKLVPNAEFVSAIHPSAEIAKGVEIGHGVAVMAGTVINTDAKIGNFCIINSKASLDHDCVMEEYASLAPNAVTGGNVKIGKYSAVSISATVSHGVSIGDHSVLGAGSVLLKDCGDHLVLYGTPAKKIRDREIGERYL